MTHPTDLELLQLRHDADELADPAVSRHVGECPDCRRRLQGQERFDTAVGRALSREPAPDGLLAAIRGGLQDEAAALESARRRGLRRATLAGLAAVVVAMLGLAAFWLASGESAGPGDRDAVASPAEAFQLVRGQLVCIGCARVGVALANQRDCRGDGGEHVTGLQTPDGNLWHFMDGSPIHEYMEDRSLRGTWLKLDARTYPDIGYLQVAAVQRL